MCRAFLSIVCLPKFEWNLTGSLNVKQTIAWHMVALAPRSQNVLSISLHFIVTHIKILVINSSFWKRAIFLMANIRRKLYTNDWIFVPGQVDLFGNGSIVNIILVKYFKLVVSNTSHLERCLGRSLKYQQSPLTKF